MSWFIVFLGFCFLIIIHEAGHFAAAKAVGMRVERFFLFFGPTIWSFKRGETEYGVKAIPLGGYVKITGMNPEEDVPPEHEENAYFRKPVWKRIVVVAAGPAVNIVLAFLIFFTVFAHYGKPEVDQRVAEVKKGTAASGVLRAGDRIIAVDGRDFPGLSQKERLTKFGKIITAHKCEGKLRQGCLASSPVKIKLERSGQVKTFSVRPRYDQAERRMLIGFAYGLKNFPVNLDTAIAEAGKEVSYITSQTFHLITHIFEARQRREVSGIVGISDIGHKAVEHGLEKSLLILGIVSLSLGLLNLLPILPLDGGHIMWALIEKAYRRPVPLNVIERATVVGIAVVLMLFIVGLSNDVGRITGEGISGR